MNGVSAQSLKYTPPNAYDLTQAQYSGNTDVSGEATTPTDVLFNSDGTQLFVLDDTSNDITVYDLATPFDVASGTAVHVTEITVSGEETNPTGFQFNDDGTKLYVIGYVGDDINEYDLNAPYDIASGLIFVDTLSIGVQEATPEGFTFNDDGMKLYVIGRTGRDINQYGLIIPYDVSTGAFEGLFSVSSEETAPTDLLFNSDGSQVFVIGYTSDMVHAYDLATSYDVTGTVTLAGSFSVTDEDTVPQGMTFNHNGSKLYMIGSTTGDVYEYSITNGFSESDPANDGSITIAEAAIIRIENETFTNAGGIMPLSNYSITNLPAGLIPLLSIDASGTFGTLSLTGSVTDPAAHFDANDIANLTFTFADAAFTLFTAAQVTNATGPASSDIGLDFIGGSPEINYYGPGRYDFDQVQYEGNTDASGQALTPTDVLFNGDGTQLFVLDDSSNDITIYDLASPFDVASGTAVHVTEITVSGEETNPTGFQFNDDGTKLYVIGYVGDDINEYDLNAPYDIASGLTFVDTLSIGVQEATPEGFTFNDDGMKLYVIGRTGRDINQYGLILPYDVSTGTFEGLFSVSSEETAPTDLLFNSDGSQVFVIGYTSDTVHAYDLATPYDVTGTVALAGSFSVASEELTPQGMTFSQYGDKLYVTGSTTDDVFEYTLTTDFTESDPANDGSITTGETALLVIENEIFTNAGSVMPSANYAITNLPAALVPVLNVDASGNFATLTITGNVSDPAAHFDTDDIANLIFNFTDAAFNLFTAAQVIDATTASSGFGINFIGGPPQISYEGPGAYDVTNAQYAGFTDTGAQVQIPTDVLFNQDGTQMFVLDDNSNDITIYNLPTAYDVSSNTATFVTQISVSAQEANPSGFEFNDDGTKLYVIGYSGDDINEYDLSAPYDIASGLSYVDSFSVAGEEANPEGLAFNDDGTKLYVIGRTGRDINQYGLSTPYDVSTGMFEGLFSVLTQESAPTDLQFNGDGTKVYVIGTTSDTVHVYDLTTPYDVTGTVSVSGSFSVVSQEATPQGMVFSPNGDKLFITGSTSDDVHEYTIANQFTESNPANDGSTTPTDMAIIRIENETFTNAGGIMPSANYTITNLPAGLTAVFTVDPSGSFGILTLTGSVTDPAAHFDVNDIADLTFTWTDAAFTTYSAAQVIHATGPASSGFGIDFIGGAPEIIYEGPYAYDVTSAQYVGNTDVSPQASAPTDVLFNGDGTQLFVLDLASNDITIYNLPTAYDVASGTAVFVTQISVSGQETAATGFEFNGDGTKLYVIGYFGDDINEYDLSAPYDIASGLTFVDTFSVAAQEDAPQDLAFNSDGTKLYVIGSTGDDVNQYSLSTAYDVSTGTFEGLFSVAAQDQVPTDVTFNADGSQMFIMGYNSDSIHVYDLTTAYDVTGTVTLAGSFSVNSEDGVAQGMTFSKSGSQLYMTGSATDDVYEYLITGGFTESNPANDGSITAGEEAIISIVNETFSNVGGVMPSANYTITNLPAGLTPVFTVDASGTFGTLILTGNVSDPAGHFHDDDIDDLLFTWTDAAFTTYAATQVIHATGPASSGIGIDFIGGSPEIIYEGPYAYDVTKAQYPGFTDTGGLVTAASDVLFNSDGTQMFVLDVGSDDITVYNLPTPYDVSSDTAVFVTQISVVAQESSPQGFAFNGDGTKLYVTGDNGDDITEYNLSTPYNIASGLTFVDSFSVSAQETIPTGLVFNGDGTKVYVIGYSSDNVNQYSLSTPYDVSTGSFDGAFSVLAQDSIPTDLVFNPDGSQLFVLGNATDQVYVYDLNTPYDVLGTVTLAGSLFVGTQESAPLGMAFSANGDKLFVTGSTTDDVHEYRIDVDFNESNPANDGSITAGEEAIIRIANETFSNAGGVMPSANYTITNLPVGLTPVFTVDASGTFGTLTLTGNVADPYGHYDTNDIADLTFTWTDAAFTSFMATDVINATGPASSGIGIDFIGLPTCLVYDDRRYDLSSATYYSEYNATTLGNHFGMSVSGDGSRMYIVDVAFSNKTIEQYTLSTPFDISTATLEHEFPSSHFPSGGLYDPSEIAFNIDGTKAYVSHSLGVREFILTTPWDLSIVSFSDYHHVGGVPAHHQWSSDGMHLYINRAGVENFVYQYDATIPFEQSTLGGLVTTYNPPNLGVGGFENDIDFNDNGTKMFITNASAGTISQYTLPTPWQISSASYDGVGQELDVSSNISPYFMEFSSNGEWLYLGNTAGKYVQYDLKLGDFNEADPTDMGVPTAGESMTITIEHDTFANAGGTLTHGVDYTINNLPTGFTPILTVAADGMSAELTLSAAAIEHYVKDTLLDLTFTWADSAFTSTVAADLCTGAGPTSSNVGVTFYNGQDFGDADDSYGNGSHAGVTRGDLYIGATPPDGDPEFNLAAGNATTDDADGTDDEGTLVFDLYKDDGGMNCTSGGGTYITAAQEYCVVVNATNNTGNPAQVVGWLDFGDGVGGTIPNGVFDANERSITTPAGTNPTAVDDGTFTTGNLPTGGTRDVVLVFTGLGVDIEQSRNETYFRVRVTTDSSFFSDASASPTGDLPDGEIEDHTVSVGTLPVILNQFDSRLDNNLLTLNWGTASEMFNIGFALWGRGGGVANWQRLNRDLQLVNGGNGAEPKRYKKQIRLSNEFSSIDELLVSSMDVDGKEHYFGPFKIGKHYGNRDAYKPIDWSSIQAEMDQRMVNMGYQKIRGRYVNLKVADRDNTNQQTQIEFTVDREGLYKIKGSDLPQSWQKLPVEALAIVDSQGNPVARHAMSVQPNKRRGGRGLSQRRFGALGSDGWIIFYAKAVEGETKLYSDNAYYRLVNDKALVRTQLIQRRSRINEGFSASYRERQHLEQDNRYLSATTTDDPWVKQVVTATKRRSKQISERFVLDKPLLEEPIDLVIGAGRITSMRGVDNDGDGRQDDEYRLTGLVYISEHGTNEDTPIRLQTHGAIGRGLWDTQYRLEGGSLASLSDNVLKVGAEFAVGEGYRINQVALDHIGIEYSRPYQAKDGERYLNFSTPDDGGLGYEVTLPRDVQVRAYAIWGNNLALIRPERRGRIRVGEAIKLRFARLKGSDVTALTHNEPVSYWVAGNAGYLHVANLIEKSSATKSSLVAKAQGANYLMVVHPSFLGQGSSQLEDSTGVANTTGRDAVSEFAAHKRGQGHSVSVVNYLSVVDAYANGQPGPSGLKAYLDALSKDGYLQYVLLIGGGSYDYKDILGKGSVTTIPSYYRPTDYFSSYTNTDADYVRDASGKLFASIGRWPVRKIEEVAVMVDKHLHWSMRNKANNTALLLAENHDARFGIRFSSMLTGLGKRIKANSIKANSTNWSTNWDTHNLFVSDLLAKASDAGEPLSVGTAVQQTRQAFKAALNDKPQLVMFNGHGSSTALSKPALFTYGDASMINEGASMWLTMACYVTFYESLEVNTLAHQLLFSGPALSISGATSYSDQNKNEVMAQGLIDGLFKDELSLGQATNKRYGSGGNHRTMQTNWATLGDPSLKK